MAPSLRQRPTGTLQNMTLELTEASDDQCGIVVILLMANAETPIL